MTEKYRRAFLVLLILSGLFAAGRALFHERRIAGDFLRYVRAGTLVSRGEAELLYDRDARRSSHVWGDPENLPEMRYKYSPALAVILAPLGTLPLRAAFALWASAVAVAVVLGLALSVDLAARRLPDPRLAWIPALAAGPPLIHLYLENIKLGQMNGFAFGGAVAAVWALDRRRPILSGWCVAVAVVAKHMPILLALWFAWKRQWTAFWWSLGAVAVLLYLLPTVTLGPSLHHDLIGEWMKQQGHLVTGRAGEDSRARLERIGMEGQSLKALAVRHLSGIPFVHLRSDRHIPDRRAGAEGIRVGFGLRLDPGVAYAIWALLALTVLAVTAWATRGPWSESMAHLLALEGGLVLLVMLLVSPESRNPHYQLAAPLYAALSVAWHARTDARGRWGPGLLAACGALGILLPSQGLVGRETATLLNAWGIAGMGSILLFAAGTWALVEARCAVTASKAVA